MENREVSQSPDISPSVHITHNYFSVIRMKFHGKPDADWYLGTTCGPSAPQPPFYWPQGRPPTQGDIHIHIHVRIGLPDIRSVWLFDRDDVYEYDSHWTEARNGATHPLHPTYRLYLLGHDVKWLTESYFRAKCRDENPITKQAWMHHAGPILARGRYADGPNAHVLPAIGYGEVQNGSGTPWRRYLQDHIIPSFLWVLVCWVLAPVPIFPLYALCYLVVERYCWRTIFSANNGIFHWFLQRILAIFSSFVFVCGFLLAARLLPVF